MSHQRRPTGSDSSTVDFGCSLSCVDVNGDRGSKTRGIRLRQLKRIDNKPPLRTAFLCTKRLCATYSSMFRGSWQTTVFWAVSTTPEPLRVRSPWSVRSEWNEARLIDECPVVKITKWIERRLDPKISKFEQQLFSPPVWGFA